MATKLSSKEESTALTEILTNTDAAQAVILLQKIFIQNNTRGLYYWIW